ncbi:hypothetical protein [Pendulispora albinea]|uniref:Uncharacterized protein n=1 Tax=Pendulispora albinea TaxID=2741071 RepID=A0ABZ2LLJ4_9BACT
MSYSVHIVGRETQAKYEAAKSPAFFENEHNLVPFDEPTLEELVNAMELRGFVEGKADKRGRVFSHSDWGAEARLTKRALYLSASGDGIFEITMFGSELANEKLAKFDPQEASWE